MDNYDDLRRHYKKGVVKVLAAPPGAGKSYRLVKIAEEEAIKARVDFINTMQKAQERLNELETQLTQEEEVTEQINIKARISRLQRKIATSSQASVLYAGPFINGWEDIINQGADDQLWHNLKSRNLENCKHFDQVNMVAEKGYTAMSYCQQVCPFKTWCEKEGYLSQEQERKKKPITYVRHQNLATAIVDDYDTIIIDENPLAVFDTPIIIQAKELYPLSSSWDDLIDPDQVRVLKILLTGVRRIMNENIGKGTTISGLEFFKLLDEQLNGTLGINLLSLTEDTLQVYQPDNILGVRDIKDLPLRCVSTLFTVLRDEFEQYVANLPYNSRIHLVSGKLEVFPLQPLKISKFKPVIISDGTAKPELYQLLFDRAIEVYSPEVYSPLAVTTVWYGSDFTRSSINRQVGNGIYDFLNWLNTRKMTVDDVLGDEFDLGEIPVDESMYDSSVLRRAVTLLKGVAAAHQKILFVTYKNVRILVEKRFEALYPELAKKISFAHYGSLRGTNRFIDHDAVLLLGCYRQPYEDLHRRIQAWASLDPSIDYIENQLQYSVAPYHGRVEGFTYPTFAHPFAQKVVDMIEEGEIRQCLDRIRLLSSETPKYAYLAISRPAAKWVTQIAPVGKVANAFENEKKNLVYFFMKNVYIATGEFPSYNNIVKTYQISRRLIKEIRDRIEAEIKGLNNGTITDLNRWSDRTT